MEDLNRLLDSLVAPTNKRYLTFIEEKKIGTAIKGEIPNLERTFSVQILRQLESRTAPKSYFVELKETMRKQNAEMIEKIKGQLPGFVGQMNKGIKEQFNVDAGLQIANLIPLDPQDESERALAYSMFIKGSTLGEDGRSEDFVGTATATIIYVKGKILFLYCYGEEKDLEWGRKASKDWSADIIAANPSDVTTFLKESIPIVGGVDWNRVLTQAVVGAIIGGIVGLIGYLIRKRRQGG